jgi:hypothetical protein
MTYRVNFFSTGTTTNDTATAQHRPGLEWGYQAAITGTGSVSATVTIQGSNDGVNWSTIGTAMSLSGTGSDVKTTSAAIPWRLHRAVIASITGTGATVVCNGEGV